MADQGVWFKLWCSSIDDALLDNLAIEDFGRWCKFGAYMKKHGQNGTICISSPARTLCSMLQVADFQALHQAIVRMPNVTVTCNGLCNDARTNMHTNMSENDTVTYVTDVIVTFKNWQKYQGDNSIDRVRKFRERVTAKKRREEMRGDEKRKEENIIGNDAEKTAPLPPKKSTRKTLDPPSPIIEAIREVTLRFPPKHLWPELEKRAADLNTDTLQYAFKEWTYRGYSPTNYSWLDWAKNGIPAAQANRNGTQPNRLREALNYLEGEPDDVIDVTEKH